MSSKAHVDVDAIEQRILRENTGRETVGMNTAASAAVVNRTHRIVHQRAKSIQARRSRMRSLWIPLSVSASMLATLAFAIWNAFEEYEVSPAGLPDASQTLVLMMWSLPITGMLLAVVWFRHSNSRSESERAR
jgi:hypothetical protein